MVSSGGSVSQETRLWDSREQRTYGMRSKEFAHDYRYFPEPDLLPLVITDPWKEEVRLSLPELPEARKDRFVREYALPEYDAAQLTASKPLANYFEAVTKESGEAKLAANWVLNELLFLLKEAHKEITETPVPGHNLAELLTLVRKGTVSGKMAKEMLAEMFSAGKRAEEIMAAKGLAQINDLEKIAAVARQIINDNPNQVEQYRSGKTSTMVWVVGQVMKATAGQANPKLVQEVLRRQLGVSNVKRWYAFCPDELHITLFEERPLQPDRCEGCGGVRELHGVAEGYVTQSEANKGRADLRPSSMPTAPLPPTRL
jgi:aspartyl-tRNA(Asn)/glutamyl-tRNA(Gln) amidotransferase subunit B